MTMQTTTLPFQVSGGNALGQPQRNAAAGVQAPESNFGATLSREIAQRQAAPNVNAAPAPGNQANRPAQGAQSKPTAADKPAAQGPKAAAREPAKQNEATDAPATAQAGAAPAESAEGAQEAAAAAESASAAAAAASNPVTDMLAFMASLAQPAQAAPAATAATEAPLAAAGGAELQLAALQSAFAKLDGADTAATDPSLASAAEGEADTGFALSAGVQPAADESADLRTLQQSAQNAVQADAGKLQGQAREAVAQAAAPSEAAPAPATVQLQAQAAKLDALNPAAAPSDRIPARVGTQAWDNQVSQRIVYMVGKEQAATLTLNPPDLGPVQIVLNVSNDQASVAFSSGQPEVRQALENALPRLREMMGENGIALGNATVDAGVPDQRQAQQDSERRGRGGNGAGPGVENGNVAANDNVRTVTRTVVTGERGAVDIFA